jgi:hypothetical protein
MLSKYTFLAPNLIRVSREGADYAHLSYCSPIPRSFGLSMDLLNLPPPPLWPCIAQNWNHLVDTAVMGQIMPTTLLLAHPDLKN